MPYKDPEKRIAIAKAAGRKYYLANRDKVLAATAQNNLKFRRDWAAFKSSLACSICGFAHPAVIDFHHPPGTKSHSVHVLSQRRSLKLLYAEILKCVILCANCHRIHHHNENLARVSKRQKPADKEP
jgi:hypothetical protein